MTWRENIVIDPNKMFGKPCIKGTRIPVDLILEKLRQGESLEHLLSTYPSITEKDLQACLQFEKLRIQKKLL